MDVHEHPAPIEALRKDFEEFITRVTSNPAHLLSEELGCYARYSDGKTSIQWIPESYNVG